MKSFKVALKNTTEEFLLTEDVWLCLNVKKDGCAFFKKDNKNELLFGISHTQKFLPAAQNIPASGLRDSFDLLSTNYNSVCLYYLNSSERVIQSYIPLDIHTVLFRRREGDYVVLNDHPQKIRYSENDVLAGFKGKLSANELDKLRDVVLKSERICYTALNDAAAFLESYHSDVFPVFWVDFSEHQAFSFPIKSSLKTVSLTIDMIKNKLVRHDSEKIWQIETVLHEALVNAITYGSELDHTKHVSVSYEMGRKGLRVMIRDLGAGFDVHNISVPVGHEALEKISGRGIYIMKKFSDALFFNEKGNELLLFFHLGRDQNPAS